MLWKGNRGDILQLAGRLTNRSFPKAKASAPSFCFNSNFTGLISFLAIKSCCFFFEMTQHQILLCYLQILKGYWKSRDNKSVAVKMVSTFFEREVCDCL